MNSKELTHDACLSTVCAFEAIEWIDSNDPTLENFEELADADAQLSKEVREMALSIVQDYPDHRVNGGISWVFFENILDIEVTRGLDGSPRRVSALMAYGGPTIWIDTDGGDIVNVRAYWGERYEMSVRSPSASQHLWDYATDLEK